MQLAQAEKPNHAFKPASQQLVDVPIMRGWNGARNGRLWETVGTRRKLAALKAWLDKEQADRASVEGGASHKIYNVDIEHSAVILT